MKAQEIEAEALKLQRDERAALVHRLLASLDEDIEENLTEDEWNETWGAEAERRSAEMDADPSLEIPAEEVFRKLRNRSK